MDIRCLVKKAALIGATAAVSLLSFGCNSGFSDPFWKRPVGQKFFVPANPESQFPVDLNSDALETRATLLKLVRQSDLGSSRSAQATLSVAEGPSLKSITLLSKSGLKEIYDMERFKKINDTEECRGISRDIRELLSSYPDLILVCGSEFTNGFRSAAGVSITMSDGAEYSFTNWGSHFSEGTGYRVVIQSLNF